MSPSRHGKLQAGTVNGGGWGLVRDDSGGRRLRAFRSLTGNRALLRVLAAYLLFILTEYAVWIAMLVFAYRRGGTAVAGLVAVAQLVPAAIVAPVVATVADRRSPAVLLAGGYLAQTAGMAGTAVAIGAGVPLAAYAAAIFASTAVTVTRPAQSALIPSVAATPDQLTAANVVAGWLEAAAVAAAGLLAGMLISLAGVASVFAVCAGLGLAAALLVTRLRGAGLAAAGRGRGGAGETGGGCGPGPWPRGSVRGCGWRSGSRGCGSCWPCSLLFVAATVSVVLVGRRLSGPILAAALAFSAALAAVAFGPGLAGTAALLVVAGAGHCLLEVATRTLLQRSVPPELIGRVFGVLEGLMMAGLAVGALLVPGLAHVGGSRLAVLGVAAVLPLAAVAGGRAVFRLDVGTAVPVVQIALLRSLPLFAELPAPAIEGLAAALRPVELRAGDVLIRQGNPGDAYFAIAAGELDAAQDGQWLGRYGRGEGVGEIALLRSVPRTATVLAHTAATVYQLDRDLFLTAVLGHAPTQRHADQIAAVRLATGPAAPHPQAQ